MSMSLQYFVILLINIQIRFWCHHLSRDNILRQTYLCLLVILQLPFSYKKINMEKEDHLQLDYAEVVYDQMVTIKQDEKAYNGDTLPNESSKFFSKNL